MFDLSKEKVVWKDTLSEFSKCHKVPSACLPALLQCTPLLYQRNTTSLGCCLAYLFIKLINIHPNFLPSLSALIYSGRFWSLPLSFCVLCLIHLIHLICLIRLSLEYLPIKLINICPDSLSALGAPTYSGRAIYYISTSEGTTQVSLLLTMEGSRTRVHGRMGTQADMSYYIQARANNSGYLGDWHSLHMDSQPLGQVQIHRVHFGWSLPFLPLSPTLLNQSCYSISPNPAMLF